MNIKYTTPLFILFLHPLIRVYFLFRVSMVFFYCNKKSITLCLSLNNTKIQIMIIIVLIILFSSLNNTKLQIDNTIPITLSIIFVIKINKEIRYFRANYANYFSNAYCKHNVHACSACSVINKKWTSASYRANIRMQNIVHGRQQHYRYRKMGNDLGEVRLASLLVTIAASAVNVYNSNNSKGKWDE